MCLTVCASTGDTVQLLQTASSLKTAQFCREVRSRGSSKGGLGTHVVVAMM